MLILGLVGFGDLALSEGSQLFCSLDLSLEALEDQHDTLATLSTSIVFLDDPDSLNDVDLNLVGVL